MSYAVKVTMRRIAKGGGVGVLTFAWFLTCGLSSAPAADPIARGTGRGYRMNYGPVLGYTINCRNFGDSRPDNLALKGLAIRLGESNRATVCFDTESLRYVAGWSGGFLDISRTHLDSAKGSHEAFVDGEIRFTATTTNGWSEAEDGGSSAQGNARFRWKGYYRHGLNVILNYEVAGIEVWETPLHKIISNEWAIVRSIRLAGNRPDLRLLVADSLNVALEGGETSDVFQVTFVPETRRVTVRKSDELDPRQLCRGGPALWPETPTLRGRLGQGAPYTVDTLPIPEQNPWGSWMRLVALDFFSDGRAAVSTWSGDVWIVSGIDESLGKVQWNRFATGLFEPLGLRIVDDTVYALCRDQLARLHDLNSDGEADWIESFNRDAPVGPSYHAFAFELQTDRAGNFYYVRCGQRVDPNLPLQGGLVKVSKDGRKSELIATGLRAANGLCVGPNDEITCADNQGNWIPASRINWVREGGFYGYVPHARRDPVPTEADPPLCWLPIQIDNSSGSQVWVTSDRWGPLKSHLLHTSYGKGTLFLVLREQIGDVVQGGVVQFPLRFDSGIMRARFHPRDGQLYVAGLKGWQTAGARDGALQRVRYTGGPVRMPVALHIRRNAIDITFGCELDQASAGDTQNYALERWNYLWSEKYGSPEFKASQPGEQGRDKMEITTATLSPDSKTVSLNISDLKPVMQMRIQFRLQSKDGAPVRQEIYHTVNALPL
ncbi:MAG: hypothetical protein L0Y58_15725 [Verrucomicrobia subdivision 3 bacterium]|nr:hypothetical protein [Limisphaerales bacterium]